MSSCLVAIATNCPVRIRRRKRRSPLNRHWLATLSERYIGRVGCDNLTSPEEFDASRFGLSEPADLLLPRGCCRLYGKNAQSPCWERRGIPNLASSDPRSWNTAAACGRW